MVNPAKPDAGVVFKAPTDQVLLKYMEQAKDGGKPPERIRVGWQGEQFWLEPGQTQRMSRQAAKKACDESLGKHITHGAVLGIIELQGAGEAVTEEPLTDEELLQMVKDRGLVAPAGAPAKETAPPAGPTKAQLRADKIKEAVALGIADAEKLSPEALEASVASAKAEKAKKDAEGGK